MNDASRFLPRPEPATPVRLTLDGAPITAHRGDTLAAALLAHASAPTRHTATNAPRAPYCMMGVCFECLVEVDGVPNTQACMIDVREGMVVRRMSGLRALKESDANG